MSKSVQKTDGGDMQSGKPKKWPRAVRGLILPVLLASCAVGPDYHRPAMNPPA